MEKKNEAIFLELEPTLEGAMLRLSDEVQEKCKVVYKKVDESNKATFLEPWDPEKKYSADCFIVPVQSVYGGLQHVPKGKIICNVPGTTYDTRPFGQSWIGMMRDVYIENNLNLNLLTHCCVHTRCYYYETQEIREKEHTNSIVGAHVYIDQADDNHIYLLPLCHGHNNLRDENYYMQTRYALYAVKLINTIHI